MFSLSDLEDRKCVEQPVIFISELGNLHDAEIESIEWNPALQEILFKIEDLHSNFLDLPEYTDIRPARLTLHGVEKFESNISPDGFRLCVMDFEVVKGSLNSGYEVSITFTPSGIMKISCASISCHSIEKKATGGIGP